MVDVDPSEAEFCITANAPENSEATPFLLSETVSLQPLSKVERRIGRIQFFALCWSLFVIGWNDGSIGPLLPRIQNVYEVDYQSVSLIFVFTCTGVVLGAVANMPLNDRFGFGKMIIIGSIVQSSGYMVQTYAPSFPLFLLSFLVSGIGLAIQDAQANGFVALVKHDGELKMGILHAVYGFGALCAPLSATQFAQMKHWSFHYLISLALSTINLILLVATFRFRSQDECLHESGEVVPHHSHLSSSEEKSKFRQMLQLKVVHLLASFLILYVGVEVTIGGWIVTFIINVRGGGFDSGYISSGFFGGLTLGRVLLIPINQRIGEIHAIYLYTVLAILSQLVIWLIPSILLDSIAVFIIGILLGPMYPIAIRHAARVIPRSLVTGSIGWIAACGAAGSAVLPFMTGWMAQNWGMISLQPFLVVMMSVMALVWWMVPKTAAAP